MNIPLNTDNSAVQKRKFSIFLFCADKVSVYENLVCPLRKESISAGMWYKQCDLLMQSDHLIFLITSLYLEEVSFNIIHLETVLGCIQMDIVPANRVLFIMADNFWNAGQTKLVISGILLIFRTG